MLQSANGLLTTFTFDAAGNQAKESAPTGRTTYVWDPDNRLRQLLLPGGERQTMSLPVRRPAHRPSG